MRLARVDRQRPSGSIRTDVMALCAVIALLAPSLILGGLRHRLATEVQIENRQGAIAAATTRDWTNAPAIVEVNTDSETLAVGDIHGDSEQFVRLLVGAGVVKESRRPDDIAWTASTAILIVLGDMIDKWPHGLETLRTVRKLEAQASEAGGRVITLLGNHEVEFLADPEAEKVTMFRSELNAAGISVSDFVSGRQELGRWLRSRPFAARVNDWFFAHAGKTDGRTVAQLEAAIRTAIDTDGFPTYELLREDSIVEATLKPHPWWEIPGERPEVVLDRLLGALNARHIVLGHQPGHVRFADGSSRERGQMVGHLGRVFLVDTGLSRGVGDSEGALLRIRGAGETIEATAVKPDGSVRSLWRGN